MFKDLNGSEPSETIDTDGDGEPDFYVYNYSTEEIITIYYYGGFDIFGPGLPVYSPMPYLMTIKVSGRVFIATFSEEPSFPDDFGGNDVLVLDNRNHLNDANQPDPGYRVYNSYKITGAAQQSEILKAVIDYDSCYPSQYTWKHTINTAIQEWEIHNFA